MSFRDRIIALEGHIHSALHTLLLDLENRIRELEVKFSLAPDAPVTPPVSDIPVPPVHADPTEGLSAVSSTGAGEPTVTITEPPTAGEP